MANPNRDFTPLTLEQWQAKTGIRKERYVRFVGYFLEELTKGQEVMAAALQAGRRMDWRASNGYPLTEKTIARKVEKLISRPDISQAFREATDVATGGDLTLATGLQKMSDWIHGNVEHDGEKLPPSQEMLSKYLALAIPKAPKQVQIDQRVLVAKALVTDEPPAIKARSLDALPGKKGNA
jgi:hypothetical protein